MFIYGEPQDTTDVEKDMIVTDYATVPEPDGCPNCGVTGRQEARACKVVCASCHFLVESCSDL